MLIPKLQEFLRRYNQYIIINKALALDFDVSTINDVERLSEAEQQEIVRVLEEHYGTTATAKTFASK